jgi:uncharacterized damage-inducible protein DinB
MTYYGAKHLADSFRTVRTNTIVLAEEIPAEKYDFTPVAGVRTVGGHLAHIVVNPRWQMEVHRNGIDFIDFPMFGQRLAQATAEEQMLRSKDEIVAALKSEGEQFASFLASLSEAKLAETVRFPEPVQPPEKSRLEMLLGVKEHEMHHRAQLMLIQRLLGIVPHLTRQREAMRAAVAGGKE